MKYLISLFFLVFFIQSFFSQEKEDDDGLLSKEELLLKKVYKSIDSAVLESDSVYRMSLYNQQLKELPPEVFSFEIYRS
ncbi:MAG: hypothetical protein B6I24_08140 [Bacteroidetes bacterium 4572_128]|nr:MAG: hypothetical protein B6I24_08140 [Bacteroidetes bacterium 4572_128]